MHFFRTHILLKGNGKCCFNSLKESRSPSIFFYFNVGDVAVATPSVSPFYSSSARIIGNIIFVQFFTENQNSCTTRTPKELMGGEKDRIKLTHFIRRMHINVDIGSWCSKIHKAVSVMFMHYLSQFIIWRDITSYIRTWTKWAYQQWTVFIFDYFFP